VNEIAGSAPPGEPIVPAPYTDRGALSEAWYRALCAAQPKSQPARPVRHPGPSAVDAGARRATHAPTRPAANTLARSPIVSASKQRLTFLAASAQRVGGGRAAATTRSPGAGAWRAALARRIACRFTLPDGAVVAVLVQQRGHRVHVVAIAAPYAGGEPQTQAALSRVRAALAAHGVRADIDVRKKGSG
jgi:hypothetical protein